MNYKTELIEYAKQFEDVLGKDGTPLVSVQEHLDEYDRALGFRTTNEYVKAWKEDKEDDEMFNELFGHLDQNLPLNEYAFELVKTWLDDSATFRILNRKDEV